jgi:hypothetical protein
MNIVFVLTYGIKDGKRAEHLALMKKFLKFKKADPKVFEGLMSYRLFEQEYGGVAGTYVEMSEFKSMEDMKKWEKRVFEHRDQGAYDRMAQNKRPPHAYYAVNMEYCCVG